MIPKISLLLSIQPAVKKDAATKSKKDETLLKKKNNPLKDLSEFGHDILKNPLKD